MKSPFKFLDSYTKDDREVFFGRDREIEELYHRVFENRIMLVYGISGTGKSSLIHCGLANKFQDTDWLPVVIRRGTNIIDSMAAAIKAVSVTISEEKSKGGTVSKKDVLSLYLDYYKPIFFIFDQFEELFIFGDKEERRAFIHIIKSLYESDLQCRMIFILREEYLSGITEFEKFIPTIFSNRVRIEKMSHRNALEAIKGPCNAFTINLEEGFAESLLEKLSPGSEDVELTYLQVFLDKIFRLATGFLPPPGSLSRDSGRELKGGSVNFTLSLLSKTGNVSDLLGSFLDEQISLMEDPDLAMSVLKAFVSGRGTKRQANEQEALDNVKSLGKEISPAAIQDLIRRFVNLRVLRDKDDNERYELRHDALAEKIFEKFSTAEKELLEIRQMIENAYQYYLKRKILLSHDDLEEIGNRDLMLNLEPELKGFMDESRQHEKARKRAVKILTMVSGFALILLLSTIIYTLKKRSDKSESILFSRESILQFTRPADRLILAGLARKASNTEEAKESLLKAFNYAIRNPGNNEELINQRKTYLINFKPASSPIIFADCSPDNRFIYGNTADSIYIWDKTGRIYSVFSTNGSLINLQMSGNGRYIGAVSADSILKVWDNLGHLSYSRKVDYNPINKDQIFRFDDENRIIAISSGETAELIDADGKTIQSFGNHKTPVNAVDISSDKRFIATAGFDSIVNIWYFNSIEKRYDIYNSIHFPADTIFSVDFAPNCKYILTTNAGDRIRVTSVNGEASWAARGKYEENIADISLGHPFFAEFNHSGRGIAVKSSDQKFDRKNYQMFAIYTDIYFANIRTGQINKFGYVNISPDCKYFVVSDDNNNYLISNGTYAKFYGQFNNYKLLQFEGKKPFFSPDGKYIYSVCNDHPESWFIDIESISAVATDFLNKWEKYF